ncbi:MAG TPA: ABC transporter permease, partial [Methylomirabilota bacterium]
MTTRSLVLQSLRYYWRTHLAVVAGVTVAVSVLAGALLVGDSVRASLRALVDERLGRTSVAVAGQGFFREALDTAIAEHEGFDGAFDAAAALIALDGAVRHEPSGRLASGIRVYGVDADFFRLHGREDQAPPGNREALLSPALAAELEAATGDSLLLRVQKPSAIPASTLQG